MTAFRLETGGVLLDRAREIAFTYDGVARTGFAGDTLASALLADGVSVFARSLYRDRPRGPLSAGREEPSAFAQVLRGGVSEPMLPATTVAIEEGLEAHGLAGRGRLDPNASGSEQRNDHVHHHCDVLVIGGGSAGLLAADEASADGARVIVADEGPRLGGRMLDRGEAERAASIEATLEARPEVTVLRGATALGLYDEGFAVIAQGTRLHHVRAGRVVLATGAIERPIAFAGNDRPGVMLAGAALAYLRRWGVAVGRRVVVFTTNDSAYETAAALAAAGVAIEAVVDARPQVGEQARALVAAHGIYVLAGQAVTAAHGDPHVARVDVAPLGRGGAIAGRVRTLECDALLVSGGWNPAAELICHTGERLRWDADRAAYLPPRVSDDGLTTPVGACADGRGGEQRTLFLVPPPESDDALDEHVVDLQRDVTVADLARAVEAGLRFPEHVKRYTTMGTGSDQGRTSIVLGLGILSGLMGRGLDDLAPTTARPPAVPARLALLAGRHRGQRLDPVRVTPMHDAHVAAGAVFEDVGQWKRPWFFPRGDEDLDAATLRECAAVRASVGAMDASTLGKIDVHGPDAVTFLNRMYTGDFSKLAVGMCKYGILCHADGMVFDDGVTMRLAEDRFLVTTTTGNAAAVLDWFEEWLQTEWPELRVHCTSVTEQWATVAIAGPRSRDVVAALAPELDVSNDAFPFMAIREAEVAGGLPARVVRVSFSGELAFEVNVAGVHGLALWEAVMAAGAPYDLTPYGTETMHVLRAEKGYFIVGQDTDGTVTPQDLGYGWAVSKKKGDFVGRRSHARPDTMRADRKHLVALFPSERVAEGAQIALAPPPPTPAAVPMAGHVTSSYDSAALGRPFALALLQSGRERIGETVHVTLGAEWVEATVADPVVYDPEGTRRDG